MVYRGASQDGEIQQLSSELLQEVQRDAAPIAHGIFGTSNKGMPDMRQISNAQLDELYRQKYQTGDRQWLQQEARRDPQQFLDVAQRIGVQVPTNPMTNQPTTGHEANAARQQQVLQTAAQNLAAPAPPAMPPPVAAPPPPVAPVILGPNGQPLPPSGTPLQPGIPAMAGGGIVTRPTVAMIGESGPEAVVPLTPIRLTPPEFAPPVQIAPLPAPVPIAQMPLLPGVQAPSPVVVQEPPIVPVNVRPATGIPAMASGGVVDQPTLALIGEAGPEAVVPLSPPPDPDLAARLSGQTAAANPQPGEIQQYIDLAARKRGIDPEVAMAVAYMEGGRDPQNPTQPAFTNPAVRGTFKTGSSWYPFQLHYGGPGYQQYGTVAGLGNEFTAATGYQPGDPAAWRASVDFALDTALKRGWYPTWYGSKPAGVTQWQGIPRSA